MPSTITQEITANQVRRGDTFVLHGHQRAALWPAYLVHPGTVHIKLVGGGDAYIDVDYPLTVTRTIADVS
ncbi:hypothetical protein ACF1DV_26080 [Streptomyces achromogenes]|uniref:hypothetical protein n=1 Tax=Streptomyces achromogenes TaxID=67255 RepID=UPI0036FAD4CB